jgi:sodium transport system permease protein
MRWSLIRLIWFRDLRDQLRDRRTIFMIAVLPLLLYPVLGVGVLQFAVSGVKKPTTLGVCGSQYLPALTPISTGFNPLPAVAWLSFTPDSGFVGVAGAAALANAALGGFGQEDPPLLLPDGDGVRFAPSWFDDPADADTLQVRLFPGPDEPGRDAADWFSRIDPGPLDSHQVDLLLGVPPDFQTRLRRGERAPLLLLGRENDERSRLLSSRVQSIVRRWEERLKGVRFLRHGLPADFDNPIELRDPDRERPGSRPFAQNLSELLARIFPFLLVIWALTGALYPAVDLCAGEKERGTMETLLICPVSREEIVYGKFLTIWVFSGVTALLNLASIGLTTALSSGAVPLPAFKLTALLWCIVLVLPLSAFFSAVCLAVGVYARSSKEGQYYLMPLFLLTMPLIFLTLTPGIELNPFYSMIPVTGVALLLQRLLLTVTLDQVPWIYFVPVLGPTVLYAWVALRWAVWQFQREEVLFREAERLDLGLWLRHLFRDKDLLPSTGQALFCFGLIMALRWLSLGLGGRLPPLGHAAIDLVAFVVAPPLFMALLLTTRPWQGLGLRWPPPQALLTAVLLVFILLPPFLELTVYLCGRFPELESLLKENMPLGELMQAVERGRGDAVFGWGLPLALAVLGPVCEELAFRGFILTGLRRRFTPGTAILLTSFLFAFYKLNVFQFVPAFLVGVVLGLLATRSRSILPSILFHLVYNLLFLSPVLFAGLVAAAGEILAAAPLLRSGVVAVCTVLSVVYFVLNGSRLWLHRASPWFDAEK